MKKAELLDIVTVIVMSYPNHFKEESIPGMVTAWYAFFKDDDKTAVELAVTKHIASNKWPPSIAEIRGAMAEILHPELIPPDVAWTAVAARWRKYGDIAVFEQVFGIAQASSFMKGENGRDWHADFDWMMRPTNISKILEHKYDDKPTAQTGQPTGALGVLARMREECDE